jgi:hypothetical protein
LEECACLGEGAVGMLKERSLRFTRDSYDIGFRLGKDICVLKRIGYLVLRPFEHHRITLDMIRGFL